jgi:hypothetical protein
LLGLNNQAPQKAIGITASGFFLPLLLPKRQRTATHYGMMATYTNKWHTPSVVWDSTLRKSKASYSMRKFDVETKRLRVISINTLK